ncbi:MAG: PAS domain S-box-containing protein [Saprospiraceae bacterium]|jgi:PAS domain S-box-containing protein
MLETSLYKILLVEDDLVDQIAFKRMVKKEKLNYDFQIAGSLKEAKELLGTQRYELVITDYQLGDGNAVALFDYLKSTPFIFATGGGDEEIAVKALKAGAFDYLIKDQERNYLKVLPLTIDNAIRRSRMNERLRLLESVIVNANDAVIIASANKKIPEIMYVNRAFVEMSGYEEYEVQKKGFGIFVGEETDRIEVQGIADAFRDFESIKSELIFYRKDGTPYWVGISIVPLKDKNGKTTHFVSIQRDITERKEAEQDLIEAREAAEQARLAESQFLANMSHEIRTPMNAVIGMTHLLMDENLSPKQLDYINALKFSADSLMGIISDILDLSKIGAGKLDFEQKQFNLYELLNSLQKAFKFKLKQKELNVEFILNENVDNDVVGDPTRLNQILTNLLGNSEKFTLEGEIGVRMKILEEDSTKYLLKFEVYDTGIGIEPNKLELVFENFKQANSQIHRKFGGTGLGLPIVKNLVELQGGSIWVDSEIGKGTTFSFILPFTNSGIRSQASNLEEDVMGQLLNDEVLRTAKVLIAEDNPMNQKLISEIMRKWKVNFEIASDGQIALDKLTEKVYDIILMDVNMPKMSGYEAAESIRNDCFNLNHKTPMIALTAAALQSEKEKVFDSGMNEFVSKPFVPAHLKKVMIRLLGGVAVEEKHVTPTITKVSQADLRKVTVDLSYLKEFSGGDTSFIREMLGLFLSDAPNQIVMMRECLESNDWDRLGKLGHRMKPNFQMLGMDAQREMAFNIETMAKNEEINAVKMKEWTEQLMIDTKVVIPILEKELEKN